MAFGINLGQALVHCIAAAWEGSPHLPRLFRFTRLAHVGQVPLAGGQRFVSEFLHEGLQWHERSGIEGLDQ
jgi:hypothetical protein